MPNSNIPQEITSSLKGIFTNINTERLTEILIALVLCFVGLSWHVWFQIPLSEPLAPSLTPTNDWSGVVVFFTLFF